MCISKICDYRYSSVSVSLGKVPSQSRGILSSGLFRTHDQTLTSYGIQNELPFTQLPDDLVALCRYRAACSLIAQVMGRVLGEPEFIHLIAIKSSIK